MNDFIEWYQDKELGIYFDRMPHVGMRYALPSMTALEKTSIAKFPFICKTEVRVRLEDNRGNNDQLITSSGDQSAPIPTFPQKGRRINPSHCKAYEFSVRKDYCWDGATIPRVFWRLIGSKTDSKFLIPSLIHDVLCENHNYVDNDRYFADKVFERLLYVSGVPGVNRWMMFHSVDNFQKFCGWRKR